MDKNDLEEKSVEIEETPKTEEVTEKIEEKIEEKVEEIKEEKVEKNETAESIENKDTDKKENKTAEEIHLENIEKQKQKVKKDKKIVLSVIIVSIVLIFAIIFSIIFALINMNNNNIVSGIRISGIDVSGLSKEEAISKIELAYSEKKKTDILLKYNEYETTISPESIEVNYNIEKAVNQAISVGKGNNIIINNYDILFALIAKKNIDVEMTINEEIVNKNIIEIESNLPGVVEEPEYYIEEDKLIITKGTEGIKIDQQDLINKLKNELNDIKIKNSVIKISVFNKIPEKIDIEKIYKEVYKEVKDAYYTKEPFTIYPEVEGIDFDIEEAKKILEEDKEKYEVQLKITKPKVTTAQIGSEAFPDLIGTHTTRYDASQIDRSTNLRLACEKINEKVVLPGEIFSYNKTLGERTRAAGYRNAKVYENGQVVDGIGGGICQISSTLYNAVLKANMEVTERANHQFVTSYIPAGLDATVVYGLTDFKFKNTRTYAVKLKASCSNGIATISIYGIKEENEYAVSFSTRTISTIPFTTKYVDDNTLPAGQEKVTQKGANGSVVETYIIKSLNGKVVSNKLLSRDTYSAMQKIILRGTKGGTAPAQTTTPTTTTVVTNVPAETVPTEPQSQEPAQTEPQQLAEPQGTEESQGE